MALAERRVVWDHIQRHYGDNGGWIAVNELKDSLAKEKYDYSRESLIELCKEYEQLGFGRLIPGRHGRRTRFSWARPPKELSYDPTAGGFDRLGGPAKMLEHPLPLRPGVTAKLVLPENLTAAEGAKVMDLVRVLTAAA